MKVRQGFVSNSSSSSFFIYKCSITDHQLKLIRNHIEWCGDEFAWKLEERTQSEGQMSNNHLNTDRSRGNKDATENQIQEGRLGLNNRN